MFVRLCQPYQCYNYTDQARLPQDVKDINLQFYCTHCTQGWNVLTDNYPIDVITAYTMCFVFMLVVCNGVYDHVYKH